ncbi:sensor histidine kinase [Chitinophaga tropicalis]|uniref:Histidine kinase n=1 Tax=Chitinophaga tropicalis TaxID=2683588 RepID=A0A7K1U0C2_9BACT|nr:sensor histidine kinase [Chitinophaga tropicalis]MVT07802.1 histidine kinase [Chitinophaga tropicalis]
MGALYAFLNYCRKHRFQSHVFFWIGVFILSAGTNYFGDTSWTPVPSMIYALVLLLIQMPATYFLAYYILPRLKNIFTILVWLLSAYILAVLARVLIVYVAEPLITLFTNCVVEPGQESFAEICLDLYKLFRVYFYHTLAIPFVFLAIKLFKNENEMRERTLQLEKEKIGTELKLLKAQLNPHFLFNTLNNIYSLSLDNSPHTSGAIFKLSEILDYILYRGNLAFVPVKEEAALIENYCGLERLRYDDQLKFDLQISIEENVEIAPLLLVSIVENAFKHGASEDMGSPQISIYLKATSRHIQFDVINSVASGSQAGKEERIGLQNLKQQLEFIYPGKHILQILTDNGYFRVHLAINL